MKKLIVFNLKREWYDKIASGEKTVEYRRICKHWAVRVGCRWPIQKHCMDALRGGVTLEQDLVAVFRLGYSRKHSDIVRRITKIDIGTCPYDGWDGEYFRISFEKGTSDITHFDLVKQPDEIMLKTTAREEPRT